MLGLPAVFFLPLRYWAVNWRYSCSGSVMEDQGSVRLSIVWAGITTLGQEEYLIVYVTVRR